MKLIMKKNKYMHYIGEFVTTRRMGNLIHKISKKKKRKGKRKAYLVNPLVYVRYYIIVGLIHEVLKILYILYFYMKF